MVKACNVLPTCLLGGDFNDLSYQALVLAFPGKHKTYVDRNSVCGRRGLFLPFLQSH
jgi:hypothetical protein